MGDPNRQHGKTKTHPKDTLFFMARRLYVARQVKRTRKKHQVATSPQGQSSTYRNPSGWFVGLSGTPQAVSLRYIRVYHPDTPRLTPRSPINLPPVGPRPPAHPSIFVRRNAGRYGPIHGLAEPFKNAMLFHFLGLSKNHFDRANEPADQPTKTKHWQIFSASC